MTETLESRGSRVVSFGLVPTTGAAPWHLELVPQLHQRLLVAVDGWLHSNRARLLQNVSHGQVVITQVLRLSHFTTTVSVVEVLIVELLLARGLSQYSSLIHHG